LVLASDYVVASESAKFSCGFVNIGLSPDTATSFFIPRCLGLKRAFELMSTGRIFSAKEALEYGVVTEVVSDSELEDRVKEVVEFYLNRPRTVIGYLKKLLDVTYSNTLDEHMGLEFSLALSSALSKDFIEGLTATVQKRQPKFE